MPKSWHTANVWDAADVVLLGGVGVDTLQDATIDGRVELKVPHPDDVRRNRRHRPNGDINA